MSDKLTWLSEGIELESLSSISYGVSPLATDDPGGDICSSYGGCNLYSCLSDGVSCSSDTATCPPDAQECQDSATATVITTVTQNSVTITISGMSSPTKTRYWQFKTYKNDTHGTFVKTTTDSNSAGITSISHTITGLTSNTAYYTIIKYGPSTDYAYTLNTTAYYQTTTTNTNYTLAFSQSSTYNSISATVTLSEKQSFDVTCTVYLDNARSLDATISAGSLSRTRTWTSNIDSATIYKITLEDNIRNLSWNKRYRTKNNFSWSTDVSAGKQFNILATDWNKFTSQLSAKAMDYDVTYNPATVAKGDKLTAEKYNNIAATINKIVTAEKEKKLGNCTTTISTVKAGDRVMADAINQLASCLNE